MFYAQLFELMPCRHVARVLRVAHARRADMRGVMRMRDMMRCQIDVVCCFDFIFADVDYLLFSAMSTPPDVISKGYAADAFDYAFSRL